MNIEVSVIIVSWNCSRILADCLKSLRDNLPGETSEIIVVDNASSDGTPEAIRQDFPEVKLIGSASNLGFARGRNRRQVRHESGDRDREHPGAQMIDLPILSNDILVQEG